MSHNQFNDYNVSAQGLILNSGSAQTILNEVIGGSPSQLRGYTEVAGPPNRFRAAVNIA